MSYVIFVILFFILIFYYQKKMRNIGLQSFKNTNFFSEIVIHDLNQPLRHLESYCDDILNQDLSLNVKKNVLNMALLVQKIKKIIFGLYHISKMEIKNKEKIDFKTLIQEICSDYSYNKIKIRGNITFLAAKDIFSIAIQNLIDNAIKYSRKPVRIGSFHNYIYIADSGIGIHENEIKNIFKPFYRINDKIIGSGIGLTIVDKVMSMHQFKIKVSSKINKGTIFWIKVK